jgi:transposase-like protein
VRLVARLIVEEGLKAAATDARGREYYMRDAASGAGQSLLSRTAASEITERLWADYEAFVSRDLSRFEVVYLFVDGLAERLSLRRPREAALAVWGVLTDGNKVLLHLALGSKDDAASCRELFQDLRRRGLLDPLLVVSDGVPGLICAIEECFSRSLRQRCLTHKLRNLQTKVPEEQWPEFKARAVACYQAASPALARLLRDDIATTYGADLPSALAYLQDDFEACIAHLRFPPAHRRAIRTTNLLERLFGEERRRTKVISNAFGEPVVLKLVYAAFIRAGERWRSLRMTESERRQLAAIRNELEDAHAKRTAPVGLNVGSKQEATSNAPTYTNDLSNGARAFWLGRVSEAASVLAPTPASKRLDGHPDRKSIESSITLVPSPLLSEPENNLSLALSSKSKLRLARLGGLVALVLAIGLTAFVAIERFPLGGLWRHEPHVQQAIALSSSSDALVPGIGAELPTPRLVARPSQGVVSSGPIALGLAIEGRAESAVVVITGLVPGMELSAGDAVTVDTWQVSTADLGDAWIAPPEHFTGSLNLVFELRLPNNRVADRLAKQFEWASSPSSLAVQRQN